MMLVSHRIATREGLEQVLGQPNWGWLDAKVKPDNCGLTVEDGTLATAGWGDSSACCRIYLHPDGFCIRPGLRGVHEDEAYVGDMGVKLDTAFAEVEW